MADTFWSSLWWQQRSIYRRSSIISPIIPRQVSIYQAIVWELKTGVVHNMPYVWVIGSVGSSFSTTMKVKTLYLPQDFSGLAIYFVSRVPTRTWSSRNQLVIFAVLSLVTVRCYKRTLSWIFIFNWHISRANARALLNRSTFGVTISRNGTERGEREG